MLIQMKPPGTYFTEHLSSLQNNVVIKRERLVIVKHVMAALMLAIKEKGKRAEDIPVNVHQDHTTATQL